MSEHGGYWNTRLMVHKLEEIRKAIEVVTAEIRALRSSTDKLAAHVPPSVEAVDGVYDDGVIFDAIPAGRYAIALRHLTCVRDLMPNVTPGEIIDYHGQKLMVTALDEDLVFFELVEPPPTGTDYGG